MQGDFLLVSLFLYIIGAGASGVFSLLEAAA
jgi:hypothetical protein